MWAMLHTLDLFIFPDPSSLFHERWVDGEKSRMVTAAWLNSILKSYLIGSPTKSQVQKPNLLDALCNCTFRRFFLDEHSCSISQLDAKKPFCYISLSLSSDSFIYLRVSDSGILSLLYMTQGVITLCKPNSCSEFVLFAYSLQSDTRAVEFCHRNFKY